MKDGKVVAQISPRGTPTALALSPSVLVALEQRSSELRIAWYDTTTGKPINSVAVPANTSEELSANTRTIVFHVGQSIRVVDLKTGNVSTVAHAAAAPIGLSIEGTRIAWAENVAGKGRIRALRLS